MPRRSSFSRRSASSPVTATGSARATDSAAFASPTSKWSGCQSIGSHSRAQRSLVEYLRELRVVVPAAHPSRQFVVPSDSAAILRRTSHPAAEAANRRRTLVEHFLDLERVVPAVTEVVDVPDGVALRTDQLVEAYVVLQHALLAFVDIEGGEKVWRSIVPAGAEAVQVAVGPAHRGLDRVVHPGEGQVARQVEPPPDRRLRADQIQPQLEPDTSGGGGRSTGSTEVSTFSRRLETCPPSKASSSAFLSSGVPSAISFLTRFSTSLDFPTTFSQSRTRSHLLAPRKRSQFEEPSMCNLYCHLDNAEPRANAVLGLRDPVRISSS